ncbi:fasciclin domain-containing protein [Oceanirhabdus sp. W0125-5]|uniref:fasciclin domain-containing protein n=1 Tax=Oceanirhabdus sp. W0125-5 TaxID=2999116 RepID=UPI0022F2DFE5|nr:fasciclin domain-containing protein [Oceanirhabdus sp. W0125-5]WBW96458.1 fasciclin domain-containing protein [Oceanirhabdus sp. W0125-5]
MKKKTKVVITLVIVAALFQVILLNCFAHSEVVTLLKNDVESVSKDTGDIVDIASNDDRFETLVTALKAAELVDTLKGDGPFTVFSPTDDAFAKLEAGKIEELLKPENKECLANILKYHVIPGKITAEQVVKLDGKEVEMANGSKAKIRVKNNEVYINDAKVVITDIIAKNGVIHVIDAVIMP